MIYCNDCKEFSDEAEIVECSEIHTELDTNKLEYYTVEKCPLCGSDYITKAHTCECGCPTINDFCDDCVGKTTEKIKELANSNPYGWGTTVDLVGYWYERNN